MKKWGIDDHFFQTWFEERETHILTGHENYEKQLSLSHCNKTTDIALATREPEPITPDYTIKDELIQGIKLKKKTGAEADESKMKKLKEKLEKCDKAKPVNDGGLARAALISALSRRRKLRNIKLKGLCPETYDNLSHAYNDDWSSDENDNDDSSDIDIEKEFKMNDGNNLNDDDDSENDNESESDEDDNQDGDVSEGENGNNNSNGKDKDKDKDKNDETESEDSDSDVDIDIGKSSKKSWNEKKNNNNNIEFTSGIRKRSHKLVVDRNRIENGKLLSDAVVKREPVLPILERENSRYGIEFVLFALFVVFDLIFDIVIVFVVFFLFDSITKGVEIGPDRNMNLCSIPVNGQPAWLSPSLNVVPPRGSMETNKVIMNQSRSNQVQKSHRQNHNQNHRKLRENVNQRPSKRARLFRMGQKAIYPLLAYPQQMNPTLHNQTQIQTQEQSANHHPIQNQQQQQNHHMLNIQTSQTQQLVIHQNHRTYTVTQKRTTQWNQMNRIRGQVTQAIPAAQMRMNVTQREKQEKQDKQQAEPKQHQQQEEQKVEGHQKSVDKTRVKMMTMSTDQLQKQRMEKSIKQGEVVQEQISPVSCNSEKKKNQYPNYFQNQKQKSHMENMVNMVNMESMENMVNVDQKEGKRASMEKVECKDKGNSVCQECNMDIQTCKCASLVTHFRMEDLEARLDKVSHLPSHHRSQVGAINGNMKQVNNYNHNIYTMDGAVMVHPMAWYGMKNHHQWWNYHQQCQAQQQATMETEMDMSDNSMSSKCSSISSTGSMTPQTQAATPTATATPTRDRRLIMEGITEKLQETSVSCLQKLEKMLEEMETMEAAMDKADSPKNSPLPLMDQEDLNVKNNLNQLVLPSRMTVDRSFHNHNHNHNQSMSEERRRTKAPAQ